MFMRLLSEPPFVPLFARRVGGFFLRKNKSPDKNNKVLIEYYERETRKPIKN
jgi:hypothetical protein